MFRKIPFTDVVYNMYSTYSIFVKNTNRMGRSVLSFYLFYLA